VQASPQVLLVLLLPYAPGHTLLQWPELLPWLLLLWWW
jgi:hypothetical protein